jgi:uncharacterized membrane protein HdeD (DUF308 family)
MAEQAKATLQKGIPWRRGLAWWIVGLEGLLLLAAGIYVVAAPDNAKDAVRVIIGAFVLANSIGSVMAGFRPAALSNPITPYRMLAAGSGLTVGIIVVLQPWTENITDNAARVILALGLLAFGIIGLAGIYVTRATGGMRRGPIVTGALSVLFAILLFYNVRNETLDMRWFGYAALAAGVLMCGYAFALYKARQVTPEVAATDSALDTVASDPAPAPAEAPPPPAPLSPEPTAAELQLIDVPSSTATSASRDA